MSYKDNAFPLTQNGTNLTSGTFTSTVGVIFQCVSDGDLTITWQDNTPSTVSCIASGIPYIIENAKQVVITSGTFHKK